MKNSHRLIITKTVRVLCAIVAWWQAITILSSILYLFETTLAGLGAASVTIGIKLFVALIAWLGYRLLARLEQKYQLEAENWRPSTPIQESKEWSFTQLKKKPLVWAGAGGIFCAIAAALIWHDTPTPAFFASNQQCTSNLTYQQRINPNLASYSIQEIAESVKDTFDGADDKTRRANAIAYLSECRWTLKHRIGEDEIYIDRSTVRLYAGARRAALFLRDYAVPQIYGDRGNDKEYKSVLFVFVTDCTNEGVAVAGQDLRSSGFGSGKTITRQTLDGDVQSIPLQLTTAISEERIVSRLLCSDEAA